MIDAENIWGVLVYNGLCHPDGKDNFTSAYNARNPYKIFSYRLQSISLGKGCKFWQDGKVMWIDAYREDITEAKQIVINKVNKELETLGG